MKISLLRFFVTLQPRESLWHKKPENGDFENVIFSKCNITFMLHSKCNIWNECNKKVEYAFDYVTFCVLVFLVFFLPFFQFFFHFEKFSHFKEFFIEIFFSINAPFSDFLESRRWGALVLRPLSRIHFFLR